MISIFTMTMVIKSLHVFHKSFYAQSVNGFHENVSLSAILCQNLTWLNAEIFLGRKEVFEILWNINFAPTANCEGLPFVLLSSQGIKTASSVERSWFILIVETQFFTYIFERFTLFCRRSFPSLFVSLLSRLIFLLTSCTEL